LCIVHLNKPTMKTNKIIYWISTAIISLMMLFSAFLYITSPMAKEGFVHAGFPDYFRIELAVAKFIGALVLIIPIVPAKLKEWAYAGFGIVFISAFISHSSIGDPISKAIAPLIFLVILIVSYIYNGKSKAA